jgi:hypothetical protein
MATRPFVSSTSEDLQEDCRPAVISAIKLCDGSPVTMEQWDVDYRDALEVCKVKLHEESTHYIGVFAYRLGWKPPGQTRSITQIEFDEALSCRKGRADYQLRVFVPKPGTDFAEELRGRAEGQKPEDETLQLEFLRRVDSGGTRQVFSDLADLAIRVTRAVVRWEESLRQLAAATAPLRASVPRPPGEGEIQSLGRRRLQRQFEDVLEFLAAPASRNASCFLIHGPATHGHSEIAARLQALARRSVGQPRAYRLSLGGLWRQRGLRVLLRLAGNEIEPGWQPESVGEVAARVDRLLETGDVVLRIDGVQILEGGSLETFTNGFWQGLLEGICQRPPYRLLVLASFEAEVNDVDAGLLQAAPESAAEYNPSLPVRLPALGPFERGELQSWLGKRLAPDAALRLAEFLLEQTNGNPLLTYTRLRDPATWA